MTPLEFLHAPAVATSLVLTASIGFVLSFRQLAKHRIAPALVLLTLSALLLRLYAASDLFLHPWDERYHALVGKHLAMDPLRPALYLDPVLDYDYRSWTSNHIWLHKPPLALWTIAAAIRLLGPSELALRLPAIIVSSATVLMIFWCGCHLLDRKSGFLASFLYAINGYFLDLVGGRAPVDHVDNLMVALVTCGVWLSCIHRQRRRTWLLLLIGLCTGLALLTKSLPALIIPAVWFVMNTDWKRARSGVAGVGLITLVAFLVAAPWIVYTHQVFPAEARWESEYNLRHLVEVLEGHDHGWTYYLARLRRTFGPLVYAALFWFVWRFRDVGNRKSSDLRGLLSWLALPYVVFTIAWTKMPGYVSIAAPAVFLVLSAFWWWLRDQVRKPALTRWQLWLARAALVLLLLFPIEYCIERLKLLSFGYDRNPQWSKSLRELTDTVSSPAVVFNTSHPIEAMFYTPFVAYANVPPEKTIRDLKRRGYEIVIFDEPGLPEYVVRDTEIHLVEP